jgi:hypothetical protein
VKHFTTAVFFHAVNSRFNVATLAQSVEDLQFSRPECPANEFSSLHLLREGGYSRMGRPREGGCSSRVLAMHPGQRIAAVNDLSLQG